MKRPHTEAVDSWRQIETAALSGAHPKEIAARLNLTYAHVCKVLIKQGVRRMWLTKSEREQIEEKRRAA